MGEVTVKREGEKYEKHSESKERGNGKIKGRSTVFRWFRHV